MRIDGESEDADHEADFGFTWVPCDGKRMFRVVAVINIGNRKVELVNRGFQGHGLSAFRFRMILGTKFAW